MDRIMLYTEEESEAVVDLPDEELKKAVSEKYDFMVGYFPGGYNLGFLLIEDDEKSSSKDKWKTIFYRKRRKLSGTITLDNVDELEGKASYEYDFYKEIDGNFEDVIDFTADNIKSKIAKEQS